IKEKYYNPAIARFLGPDPVLQNPYSTQPACRNASTGRNYNRYSYVVNNPLKYTDPTGYRMSYQDFVTGETVGSGGSLPSWYAGDDFFGGNSNNSNYHFYNNISHIANNQLGASGDWVYNFVSGEYDNALTGETMSRASMSYYLNSKAKRNDTGLDGRQVIYDSKNNTVTANLFDIYETAYSFGDDANGGGNNLTALGLAFGAGSLLAEGVEGTMGFVQIADAEVRAAAVRNNMPTDAIDDIMRRGGFIKSGAKWVGRGFIVAGAGISVYEGAVAYSQGDMNGVAKAGTDLGVGLGCA